jgi:hypothetical protein
VVGAFASGPFIPFGALITCYMLSDKQAKGLLWNRKSGAFWSGNEIG